MNSQELWKAVSNRDPAYDGSFFFGVTSTMIYCRPSCSSRRAKRENVQFFALPEVAEAAGFRACRRCLGIRFLSDGDVRLRFSAPKRARLGRPKR